MSRDMYKTLESFDDWSGGIGSHSSSCSDWDADWTCWCPALSKAKAGRIASWTCSMGSQFAEHWNKIENLTARHCSLVCFFLNIEIGNLLYETIDSNEWQ